MPRIRTFVGALVALGAVLAVPRSADAANILFVADSDGDLEIASALMADGHTVTSVTSDFSGGTNTMLGMPLDSYDAVYWSADGPGYGASHTDPDVFTNLTSYVSAGGRVFVTGYDSIASPTDSMLIAFLGGSGSNDNFSSPGAIAMMETSLTVGVADIRGVTPSASGDHDCLTGLGADTVMIAESASTSGCAQWSLRTLGGGEIAYVSNDGTGSEWSITGGGAAGAYNAAIRNFASAAEFAMSDEGAPEITFDAPFSFDEGGEPTVSVTIEDLEGDVYTHSWDLDDDGTFGEREGEFSYTVPAGTTDGPSALRIGLRAEDEHGNMAIRYRTLRVINVDPMITSEPPAVTSVGVDLDYQLEVTEPAGDLDPLTYEVVEGPPGLNVNDRGRVTWIPTESDVTLPGESVAVELRVSDDDMGTTTQRWELTVSPNRRPSSPVPSYPIDMVAILNRQPRLVAQNAEDLDLDPLTYVFQIDTVDTFDSEDLMESEAVAETPGFTEWTPPEPLAADQLYHWRVKANDGTIDSEWRSAAFYVVRDPDAPLPDAGPPTGDGGTATGDGGLIPGLDGGDGDGGDDGGCSVGTSGGGSPLGALVALGAALFLVRRRR
ncbi:MAG TPA: MYXO-CTERM sorting domain-containing protein [Sandaracinaceae bacterium LLY-WYZ-13_1]|nr:MYXO-CTERM sorting domain-containing protein [Sandaracinaceae bacterium LLY-WYZ-13_1]